MERQEYDTTDLTNKVLPAAQQGTAPNPVVSTISVPLAVLVLTAFMASVPDDLVRSARIDGAGPLRVFWSIVLPAARNGVVTAALLAFLWSWSDFVFAATLDSGGALKPLPLGIYRYIGTNNQEWNAIMATARRGDR